MSSIYKEKILALEKAAFLSAIGSGAGKLAGLNDKQKEALRKEVRKQYITPGSTYLDIQIPVAGGGPVVLNRIRDLTGPNGFPSWFTSDLHEGSKNKENIASEEAYTKYIDNNLEDQISKYYAHRFDEVFTDNAGANLFLRTQATNYLTKLRKSRADTNLHLKIEGNIDDRPNGRHSLHPKAMNLLVSQEKINITGQSVDINTNAGSESVDTPHPDEYDLDLNISKSNLITAEIKIKGQSAFRLKGAFPSIIRTILSRPEIAHGKTRVHISYNVVRGLIQMAEKRGIDLSYRDENTGHTMVVRLDGDNIVLEEQDDRTNSRTTNKRIPNILFNSQDFKDTNIFDGEENGSLESGIDNLMTHFTQAMNQVHAQRHEVIKKKWMTQTKLPNKFYASPIKRLLNSKKNTNFDFKEEKVTGADGRTADISYTAGVFTIAMEGLKKPVSNKSLGKLLEDEIFIGIDVEIWGKMYETLVNNLRKNEKIANCTFGVADPKTGRVYTIDKDGDFGYYSPETTNPIKRKNVGVIVRKAATTTLLAGAAILTSGIAASIAGVFTFASAMDTGMYLRENTHKNRGIIPESTPTAPVICTEIEKQKILKDPFIMSGLIRAMSERLGRL